MKFYLSTLIIAFLITSCSEITQIIQEPTKIIIPASETYIPTYTSSPTIIFTTTPTITPTISPTPIGGGSGQIAFVSDRDGNQEIFVMQVDGIEHKNISNNDKDDYSPSWSPDGEQIAFVSERDGNRNIYLVKSDGSGLRQLTKEVADDSGPSWSPDGTKILYTTFYESGLSAIQTVDVNQGTILKIIESDTSNSNPNWSPDGGQIAFTSGKGGNFDIYVINSDGINLRRVTTSKTNDVVPIWSPNGNSIAFISDPKATYIFDIFTIQIDGSNIIQMTTTSSDSDPVWSPDGTQIVFRSNRNGNWEGYIMDSDGGNQISLGEDTFNWGGFNWSPDGQLLVFAADNDGNNDIYILNLTTFAVSRLTENSANDYQPVWAPN